MNKNVLVLHCSPREGGNTHSLAEMFSAGAEAAGHRVNRLNIGKAIVGPCAACGYCREHDHICVQEDDMVEILGAIVAADCVAFAAPLYFFGLPAQMKLVLDRLYTLGPQYPRHNKETVLLLAGASSRPQDYEAAVKNYQLALIDFLKWQDKGVLLAPGVSAAGEIKENPILAEAFKIGFNL
jgi:multimeric flavodoxin WrbA